MKTSKIAAGGLGITLIAAMTLGGAVSSASAADFYVTELGVEGSSYPEGWFTGTIPNPMEEGTAEFSPYGLEITGKMQILNGTPVATGLNQLANNMVTYSYNNNWYFQIPVFGNGATDQYYTTLVPVNPGYQNSAATWRTTGAIRNADNSGNAYAAGATATLDEFETAFNAQLGVDFEILAYGYFWDNGASDTLISSRYGATDTFYFEPEMKVSVSPNPVSIGDFTAAGKGVAITATGVYPFETVLFEIYAPGGSGGVNIGEAEADENGVATLHYFAPAGSALGTYSVVAYELEGDEAAADFTVTLAATGAEFNPALFIGATSLLLAGAVLMIVRSRKATA